MAYRLRLRFHVHGPTLKTDAESIDIHLPDGHLVTLKARDTGKPLASTRQFVVGGGGFSTSEEARRCGERVRAAIRKSSVELRMGFDIGKDLATSQLSDPVKHAVHEKTGTILLHDVHGLTVYQEGPVRIFSAHGYASVSTDATRVVDEWKRQYGLDPTLDSRDVLALELYSIAQQEPFPRAKFVTLISVVEVLADPQLRHPDVVALIDGFVEVVESATIAQRERDSLAGILRLMRKESIRTACRRYVEEHLGGADWKEFDRLYKIRSTLMHEGDVEPDTDLSTEVTKVEGIVSRLLSKIGGRS